MGGIIGKIDNWYTKNCVYPNERLGEEKRRLSHTRRSVISASPTVTADLDGKLTL